MSSESIAVRPPVRVRIPLLRSAIGATGLLGLCQAGVLFVRNQSFMSPQAALGFGKLAMIVALATMLLLLPVALLLRRRHPGWRDEARLQASWSACMALAAALVGWMIANLMASLGIVPPSVAPWLMIFLSLAGGAVGAIVTLAERWINVWCWISLALVVVCFLPFGGPPARPASPPPPPAATADASRPDVVLISIDTLRADHLGLYGRAPSLTPNMDQLGAEGVVFKRAVSASPWTVPSLSSMLTGLPAVRHDAGRPLKSGLTFLRSPLGDSYTTLAERFAASGYKTHAVTTNAFVSAETGLAQGFDTFENPGFGPIFAGMMRDLPLPRLVITFTPPEQWGDSRASAVTDAALRILGQESDKPVFLWTHYVDPHTPYQKDPAALDPLAMLAMVRQVSPPVLEDGTVVGEIFGGTELVRSGSLWLGPKDRERLQQYYAGEVTYTDTHIGRLLAALRKRTKRPLLVAVTADHGEEFWDHGHFEHGHDYYREVTWIPLLFWGPNIVPAGRSVDTIAGLVDVGPTLLDLAGLPVPEAKFPDDGRSLTGTFRGDGGPAPVSVAHAVGGNLYGLPAALLEDGPWRFILRANGVQELYDVTRDPAERHNVATANPEVVAAYRKRLEPQLATLLHTSSGSAPAELSPEQIEALKSLGYVH
jgi:arylsulfatase A-like enzyme